MMVSIPEDGGESVARSRSPFIGARERFNRFPLAIGCAEEVDRIGSIVGKNRLS